MIEATCRHCKRPIFSSSTGWAHVVGYPRCSITFAEPEEVYVELGFDAYLKDNYESVWAVLQDYAAEYRGGSPCQTCGMNPCNQSVPHTPFWFRP